MKTKKVILTDLNHLGATHTLRTTDLNIDAIVSITDMRPCLPTTTL